MPNADVAKNTDSELVEQVSKMLIDLRVLQLLQEQDRFFSVECKGVSLYGMSDIVNKNSVDEILGNLSEALLNEYLPEIFRRFASIEGLYNRYEEWKCT